MVALFFAYACTSDLPSYFVNEPAFFGPYHVFCRQSRRCLVTFATTRTTSDRGIRLLCYRYSRRTGQANCSPLSLFSGKRAANMEWCRCHRNFPDSLLYGALENKRKYPTSANPNRTRLVLVVVVPSLSLSITRWVSLESSFLCHPIGIRSPAKAAITDQRPQ